MTQATITESLWWIIPGKLAGMRRPECDELDTLQAIGIGAIVSVMDDPSNLTFYESAEIPYHWFPTKGGAPPTREQVGAFRIFVEEQLAAGRAISVHCSSGRRRTATFLGAYLILTGASYEQTLDAIVQANPAVEMRAAQLNFLKSLVPPLYSSDLRKALSWVVADIHSKGWAQGTGGNFSAALSHQPTTLLMTPSGVDKGLVQPDALLEIDADGQVVSGKGKASAETLLHLAIVESTRAGAVLHTHSIFGTLLSIHYAPLGEIVLSGYEMLKGLEGIRTHEAQVSIPIMANSQNMVQLSQDIRCLLQQRSGLNGLLLAGHGLYAWGDTLFQARRHVEIIEFCLELAYRQLTLPKIT
ncbi:MAG: methylthioribulose 1-phosphate dehydratase [Leptolyngbyaceae cyanobacterium MO_188.B28]|nr:methylthioribulose 1-phosphate dehydratase [Leptolyngbyaceae cyanobacterium MO_188.B28]